MCCGRFLLFVLNFLVLGVGVGLITLASMVISRSSQYGDLMMDGILTLPIWTIVVGLFITMIGFLGCWGALRQNKCMLYTYSVIVFILFGAQITLGVMILVGQDEVKSAVKTALMDGFSKYPNDDNAFKETVDLMQRELKCCGVNNYTDWFSILGGTGKDVTPGCCIEGATADADDCYKDISENPQEAAKKIYTAGCYSAFIDWVDTITIGLGVTAIILALIQLACVFYACSLARSQ